MRVAVFSTKDYDRRFLDEANQGRLDLHYFEVRLDETTCGLADNFPVVCAFVNDDLGRDVLLRLFGGGTRMIALRCAGFNNVDFLSIRHLGIAVARVPAYSPHSISEFTIGLILALSRKICRAYQRTREGNFSLDGLLGFNIQGKTAGIFGTGKIGALTAIGLHGLGCRVLACDTFVRSDLQNLGIEYVDRDRLFQSCDIISLHCPLCDDTRHLINDDTIDKMRHGIMLVNTSRGALVDTAAVIRGLKSGKIGSLAMDVYEEESGVFFEDYTDRILPDDILSRILSFPNVIVTGHQAFFTVEALRSIAEQTIDNILAFQNGETREGFFSSEGEK